MLLMAAHIVNHAYEWAKWDAPPSGRNGNTCWSMLDPYCNPYLWDIYIYIYHQHSPAI